MRSMKLILGMLLVTAGLSSAFAQDKSPEERAQKQTETMTVNLSLTEDQIPKVYEINLGVIMKNDVIKKNEEMSDESKKEAFQGNNDGRKALLKTVLTEEQFAEYEKREQMRAKRQEFQKVSRPIKVE